MSTFFYGIGGTQYKQVARGSEGRVGVTENTSGRRTVRVEPTNYELVTEMSKVLVGWNQPEATSGKGLRFSTYCISEEDVRSAIKLAKRALKISDQPPTPPRDPHLEAAELAVKIERVARS